LKKRSKKLFLLALADAYALSWIMVMRFRNVAVRSVIGLISAAPLQARPRAPLHAAGQTAAPAMAVSDWASLDPAGGFAARTGLIRNLNTTPPPEATENVFVYARRGGSLETNWREDLRPNGSTYEAGNSDAATAPYASYPTWDNPGQERMMSDVKDALGLCGAILTCPNKN
jgi:hypothetical protein